jgi:hypothetical protein
VVVLWLGCRCLPSVNIICGRIDNDNPSIIRPHIVLTDGRQQRQPNHNTTKYCVNRRKTTTTNQSKHDHILCSLYVVVLWFGCRCLPLVNTICGRVMIGCRCVPSVNTIGGRVMIGLSLSSVSEHNMTITYCVYWRTTTTTQ